MSDATSQSSAAPNTGGSAAAVPAQDPGATTTTPAAAPAAAAATAVDFDPQTLTQDQLNKVLENKELWNTPRLKELREQAAKAKKLEDDQAAAADKGLVEQKKFEELAEKRAQDLAHANERIQTMNINQALTNQLVKENVVDLDGALKLVDRTNIKVDDNGQVTGADEALTSLKKDRAYLFTADGTATTTQPVVGTASNPAAPAAGSGTFKFKESQLTPEFYAANKAAIDEAGRLGLIEPDGPPR